MRSELFKAFLSSLVCVYATPVPTQRGLVQITPEQILKIAPSSNSCPSPPGECATNTQAAPFLNEAMSKYQISSLGEKASILALIAFESGDFKYNTNHFPAPGRPGQGTRNMQTAPFNLQYVKSIPELASKNTHTSVDGLSPSELNEIRALVLPDKYSWASAAWYLTSQTTCSSARKYLQTGSDEGFNAHMKCVGISSVGSDRLSYWQAAKTALRV
ncbi:hypothetical protein HI914_02396 [Erysiphe necator]|uniref:Transglycosylase SLT domain-containing protein n=1 Tax=Uncinula necator TaxID=52586 RepID=A0A0B1P1X4_UNCNE|nr:hypothetical protein HI914_02396 [Erysiphe necator]KHJ31280.1 hypothetical protein EV44_g0579 [Erysiphe necator]